MTDIQPPDDRRVFNWAHAAERHVQTVALALITALLLWVGAAMRQMYDAQITQAADMASMRGDMSELSQQVASLRTQLQGVPTHREMDARFGSIERRLDTVERAR